MLHWLVTELALVHTLIISIKACIVRRNQPLNSILQLVAFITVSYVHVLVLYGATESLLQAVYYGPRGLKRTIFR